MSESRISIAAEIATAFATVTYPIMRLVSGYIARRRLRLARHYAKPAAVVEARLVERCGQLEARLSEVEQRLDEAA